VASTVVATNTPVYLQTMVSQMEYEYLTMQQLQEFTTVHH